MCIFQPHIIDSAKEVVVWVMQDVKLHDFENIDLIYSNYIIQHQNGNSIPFLSKNVIKQF